MDIKTLYSKIAAVPTPINIWLGSDAVGDFLENVCNQFDLPESGVGIISKIIQKIQIKELSAEYFSGQISIELGLDKEKSLSLASEIKKGIFRPIKNNLSSYGIKIDDLDIFKLPPQTPTAPAVPMRVTILSDAKAPSLQMPMPAQPPRFQANATSASGSGPLIVGASMQGNNGIPPVAPRPSLSDKGWSKTGSEEPVIQLDLSKKVGSIPMPVRSIASAVPPPAAPSTASHGGMVDEFARLGIDKETIPAPVMLQQESQSVAAIKNVDFHLSRPGGEANMELSSTAKPKTVTGPAILEFAKAPQSSTAPSSPSEAKKSNPNTIAGTTHYTEFKPSLASVPSADSGPRNITEVTEQTSTPPPSIKFNPTPIVSIPTIPPKPPVAQPNVVATTLPVPNPSSAIQPPMPPSAPSPIQPPANSQPKVIVKDFL